MSSDLKPLYEYIRAIEKTLVAGIATEHTYRPDLKALLESLGFNAVENAVMQLAFQARQSQRFIVSSGNGLGLTDCVGKQLDIQSVRLDNEQYIACL